MADTYSTHLNFTLPEVGLSVDTWGAKLNANFVALDTMFPGGDLAVASGGTGAGTPELARANLAAAGVGVINVFTAQQIMALALAAGAVVPLGIRNSDPAPAAGSAVIFDLDPANNGPGSRSAQLEAVTNGLNQIDLYVRLSNADLPARTLKLGYNGDVIAQKLGGAIGYAAAAKISVTQTGARNSAVTANALAGDITLVSAAGSTAWTFMRVNNSYSLASDIILVNQRSGTDAYEIHIVGTNAGNFDVMFRTTGGTTTEQPVFGFVILRGAAT